MLPLALALVAALAAPPQSDPMVLEVAESAVVVPEHWRAPGHPRAAPPWYPTLVVRADGRWTALERAPEYDVDGNAWRSGRLDADALARLRTAIADARLVPIAGCDGPSDVPRRRVRAGARVVVVDRGPVVGACAARDPSVPNLVALARGLTVERAARSDVLVAHRVVALPSGDVRPDVLGAIVVRRDGAWTAGARAGRLAPDALRELERLVLAVAELERGIPSDGCVLLADAVHTLDLGPVGARHWETVGDGVEDAARCRPLPASVTALVARLAAL